MEEAWPSEIQVREADGVVRYTLPRRSLGLFGAIPLLIGVGILTAGLGTWRMQPPPDGFFFVVFGCLFPLFGGVATVYGLHLVSGNVTLEVNQGGLRASSRTFGLGWWREYPLTEGAYVEAGRLIVEDGDPRDPMGDLCMIVGRRRRPLANNYELRLLRPLAAELNRRLGGLKATSQSSS